MNINSFEFVRNPCDEAAEWVKSQRSIKSAWKNCQHGTWMLWAITFSPKAKKLTEEQKDALIVWLRKNIHASAYASAYAYASADADADGKIADYLRKNISFPWSKK
mgnify:CR=1 FL=1